MLKKILLIALIVIFLITGSFIGRKELANAYAVCRSEMLTVDGYGVWEYQETSFVLFPDITIVFDDGTNFAECYVRRGSNGWYRSREIYQTIVGCLDCPIDKFGVTP